MKTLQWKRTELLQEIKQLDGRNSQLGSGRRCLDFVELNPEAGSKVLEENRKSLWCNGGVHHCGHRNQVTKSWRWHTVQPGLVWFIWKCRFTYRLMANMGKTEWGTSNMVFIRRTVLGYGGGWARNTAHQSYQPRNSEKVLEKTTPTSNVIQHRK